VLSGRVDWRMRHMRIFAVRIFIRVISLGALASTLLVAQDVPPHRPANAYMPSCTHRFQDRTAERYAPLPDRRREGSSISEGLVPDDGSMAHALILVEDAVGKYLSRPADPQAPIREVVETDWPPRSSKRALRSRMSCLRSYARSTAGQRDAVRDGTGCRSSTVSATTVRLRISKRS
jgi:hypothetical protein